MCVCYYLGAATAFNASGSRASVLQAAGGASCGVLVERAAKAVRRGLTPASDCVITTVSNPPNTPTSTAPTPDPHPAPSVPPR